ncbi:MULTISPECIES: hypothetical protein [unclassified Mesorhizobium]|uniref:hypothetical protein n=1 Tax=unclassified Mesorhizobium TaxID=325217 RepID=UPI0003CE8F6C|nr:MULTISPECIES: hypothetical protein [unclassified Mesorhizobium]ESY16207.1 hypothetical protein X751_21675 [Mesorhizobium sp. LNJC395A00]WJI76583.1 hypothetical protein NLY37_07735 [Mesorhizobium sp. C395A]
MEFKGLSVSARQLGTVLDLTDRRIRQLAEEGVFPRIERGQYPLIDCIQSYIATVAAGTETDDLRQERIQLMRAQRRRIELDNVIREGTEVDLSFQDTIIGAVAMWWLLQIRPIATWLFEDLRRRGVKDERIIAGQVENWIIALRHEGEEKMLAAAAKARKQGIIITGFDDLARLVGSKIDDSGNMGEPPSRRTTKEKTA